MFTAKRTWSSVFTCALLLFQAPHKSCGKFFTDDTRIINMTQNTTYTNGILTSALPRPYQGVSGSWQYDLSGPTGSLRSFSGETDSKRPI
jgi:hypothetical protein